MKKSFRAMTLLGAMAAFAAGALAPAHANTVIGTIHTLHINLDTNRAHIYLDGQPTFDGGGGCTGFWTGNSLDEDKFMIYVWTALTNAKNKGYAVSIDVVGCEGGFPKIRSIDVVPR
jgi:hypothetical protein